MKKIILYGILLSLTCIGCLVLFTLYLRFSYLIVPFHQTVNYEIKLKVAPREGYYKFEPGVYQNPSMSTSFTINSDGFRGVIQKSDLQNGLSIVALGESSTMGIEVNDGDTWPALLQDQLALGGLPSNILNTGVGGINSTQMLSLYKKEIADIKPSIIVYYAGRNDHGLGVGFSRFPGFAAWPNGFWNWVKNYLVFKKTEFRFIQYKLFGKELIDVLPKINQWLPIYGTHLAKLIELTKSEGTCFIIAQQLMPFEPKTVAYLSQNKYDAARASVSIANPAWTELFRQIDLYELQSAIANKYQIPFLNLIEKSDFNNTKLFVDTVHLTKEGNSFIASHLTEAVQKTCKMK